MPLTLILLTCCWQIVLYFIASVQTEKNAENSFLARVAICWRELVDGICLAILRQASGLVCFTKTEKTRHRSLSRKAEGRESFNFNF